MREFLSHSFSVIADTLAHLECSGKVVAHPVFGRIWRCADHHLDISLAEQPLSPLSHASTNEGVGAGLRRHLGSRPGSRGGASTGKTTYSWRKLRCDKSA